MRLVNITFADDWYTMFAKTDLTDDEIEDAYCNEEYDTQNMDIEMKMIARAGELNKKFKKLEVENVKL